MSFAGNAVATPTLQQSEDARRLTVCVIYGHDIIPRLGSLSITKLMDDLSDAGVYSLMKKAVARTKSAVAKSAVGETAHDNQYFPMWRGLPDGGTCAGCGRKRMGQYCSRCFLCDDCSAGSPCGDVGVPNSTGEPEPEPEPEPELEPQGSSLPTEMALQGRVLWARAHSEGGGLRWFDQPDEWRDFGKVVCSAHMAAHHLPRHYLASLGADAGPAGGG